MKKRQTENVDQLRICCSLLFLIASHAFRGAELHDDIHNGGAMLFGKDGYLYVTTGDSGDNTNGQERTNVHGSLVRLNEDGSIPRDNPYFDHDTLDSYHCGTDEREGKVPSNLRDAVCQETWGIGLRNPFRLSMNPNTDDDTTLLAISDVGAGTWEEISYGGTNYKGANYGYKVSVDVQMTRRDVVCLY